MRPPTPGEPTAKSDATTASNGLRLIGASALQNAGDQVVNAGTVLPWLLTALGAPVALVGLLVPLRESGSLLPQAALSPLVQRRAQRKWVWVAGGTIQAVAAAAMALVAATASGTTAGVLILTSLAMFAFGRSLSSLASKDVLARIIPKGQRGQINGVSTVASGVVALTIGLGIRLLGGDEPNVAAIALLLGGAALAWAAGAAVYAAVEEPVAEPEVNQASESWLTHAWNLLSSDAPFRRFVLMRTLLLVSALSPPFLVTLSAAHVGVGLASLGPFVIAHGVARLLGGRFFGRLADRSSRDLMAWGALAASVLIVVVLVLSTMPAVRGSGLLYSVAYFFLALVHTGVRVARKTYVVDMAEPEEVTDYVAVSNTAMGVLLLVTGAVNAALAALGSEVALGFLALLGLIGVLVARTLPDVSVGR